MTESFRQGTTSQTGIAQFYNTHESLEGLSQKSGVGGVYHGNNCATLWRGNYYTVVQDKPFDDEGARQSIARWDGTQWVCDFTTGWPAASYRIQHIESIGGKLFMCGYQPLTGRGIAALVDAENLTWLELNWRVDRLDRVIRDDIEELVAVAQAVTDDDPDLDTIAYSLLRIHGTPVITTFFYNPDVGDNGGYCAELATLAALGVDPLSLPPYLAWNEAAFAWIPSEVEPDEPYLQRVIGSTTICYIMHGEWPYDPEIWDTIEITPGDPRGPVFPQPSCTHADCVLDKMPEGTKYFIQELSLGRDWWAMQVDDTQNERRLSSINRLYPATWLQIDDGDVDDFTTYTNRVRRLDWRHDLPITATTRIRVCYLVPPTSGELREFVVQPME